MLLLSILRQNFPAAEEIKETSQGNDEFDGGENNSKKHARKRSRSTGLVLKRAQQGHARRRQGAWPDIRPEQKTIPRKRRKKKIGRELQQPSTNPIGGSCGWEQEIAARARSERAGNLAGYATRLSNKPEEDKKEEYTSVNHKQPARNPVGENQGWENENEPTSAPSMLGIHGGRAGQCTKQATTLPEEGNKQNAGTKERARLRVIMGENPILQNTIGGGNE